MYAYVGTFTRFGNSAGIYAFELDEQSGQLRHVQTTPSDNPTIVTVAAAHRVLYAALHTRQFRGDLGGGIAAYGIDPERGMLTRINEKAVASTHPNFVTTDQSERVALVSCGLGAAVSAFPIRADGGLYDASDLVRHPGKAAVPMRPSSLKLEGWPPPMPPGSSMPHSVAADPSGRFALVPDLYLNRVFVYHLDAARGTLTAHDIPWVEAQDGAGPRHLAFHPDGSTAYVVNELGSSVTAYAFSVDEGRLAEIQTVPTLPAEPEGPNAAADITIHPSGHWLYASNRGHDSIAVFRIDPATQTLEPRGHVPAGGLHPRGFQMTPDGRILLVANQYSNNVVAFAVNDRTGEIRATGAVTNVPSPTSIVFFGSLCYERHGRKTDEAEQWWPWPIGRQGTTGGENMTLRELFRGDQVTLGGWSVIPGSFCAELMGRCGFDWVCIDMQHGLIGYEQMTGMIQALSLTGTPAFVRVPWNQPDHVMKALDAGAQGILIPMVSTGAEARQAVEYAKYPPVGIRSWGPVRASLEVSGYSPTVGNERTVLAVMIETAEGVRNMDEIMAVEGVDAVYIGPSDLALGHGMMPGTGRPAGPEHERLILSILEGCQRHNVVPGIQTYSVENATHWRDAGFRMLAYSSDGALLRAAAGEAVTALRGSGDRPVAPAGSPYA